MIADRRVGIFGSGTPAMADRGNAFLFCFLAHSTGDDLFTVLSAGGSSDLTTIPAVFTGEDFLFCYAAAGAGIGLYALWRAADLLRSRTVVNAVLVIAVDRCREKRTIAGTFAIDGVVNVDGFPLFLCSAVINIRKLVAVTESSIIDQGNAGRQIEFGQARSTKRAPIDNRNTFGNRNAFQFLAIAENFATHMGKTGRQNHIGQGKTATKRT